MIKLNIGCGWTVEDGWIGLEYVPAMVEVMKEAGKQAQFCDVRNGLPYEDNSVDYIYSEDFFEHLTRREGLAFLKECKRVLKPNQPLRIATPDLEAKLKRYISGNWLTKGLELFHKDLDGKEYEDWDTAPPGTFKLTHACEAINVLFYYWGHQWIYDEEYLKFVFARAGFQNIKRCEIGQSEFSLLRNMERRVEEDQLIIEGRS